MPPDGDGGAPPPAPPPAPPAPAESIESAHAALSAIAAAQNCCRSDLNGTVSVHEFVSATASFQNLSNIYKVVKESARTLKQTPFIGSVRDKLVFSSRFAVRTAEPAPPTPVPATPSKKRARSDADALSEHLEGIHDRAKRVAKVPEKELETGVAVLANLIGRLRGSQNELVVESFALLQRKLDPNDERVRVVLAVRLAAGVPVPLALLKRNLGACWSDGVITTASDAFGIGETELPLGTAAKAAIALGNRPLFLVTAVPIE